MRLRDYTPSDAPLLAALYRDSVCGLGPRHYAPEQVAAWASRTPTPERMNERCAASLRTLVAVDGRNRPLGFANLERDGHIDCLYCAPDAAGTGIAGALCDALEATARDAAIVRLHVEASEAAKRFFLRRGFTVLHRRDLSIGAVPIHNFAMEKRL